MLRGSRSICVNDPRKKQYGTEGQRCPGMGRERRQPPGAAEAHSPAQGGCCTMVASREPAVRSFKPSALQNPPRPHPAKPPPPSSGRLPARRFTVPAAPRGKLRHGVVPMQAEPRSPTVPGDPRVETSSPRSFPGLGSKRNKRNLFPAGENPAALGDTGAPAAS